jgi:AcrR family transcriptional regulator
MAAQPSSPYQISDAPRGAQARERMVQAALNLFGRHGFGATTTRMIAQAAQMNLGAIPYYFGSKEDLYAEAAGFLADYIERKQAAPLRLLKAKSNETDDVRNLIALVVDFMRSQARLLLADEVPASWVQFFLRAQTEHGEAFERIFTQALEPIEQCVTEILARIIRRSPDDMRTRTLSFIVLHQFVCFRLADSVLMRRMAWDTITPERVEQLLDVITPHLHAQLLSAANLPVQP